MVRDDGTFELTGVFGPCRVGAYRMAQPGAAPDDWMLKSISQGGADVTEQSIEVPDKGVDNVEIVFTNRITTVTGTVTGTTGAPVVDYTLVVFPDDKTRWGTTMGRRLRVARPDQRGMFNTRGLPPGDYLVAAVERFDVDTEWDPETLARLAPFATRVTLTEGAKQTVTIKLAAFP